MKRFKTPIIVAITLAVVLAFGYTSTYGPMARVEENGGLAVNVQDQTTPPVDLFFTQADGAATTLDGAVAINDVSFDVTAIEDITVGDYLGIFSGASGENRFFFAEVLTVVSTTVTVDTPIDFAFDSGDPVQALTRELDVLGTSGSPLIFSVQGAGVGSGLEIDITRIMFSMILGTAGDDGLFGNLTALTNGVVFRRVDGDTRNVFNIKDNGELATLAFDVAYTIRSSGGGEFGLRGRYTFAGQDKHGVALRLMPGDELQLIIQDDLTGLNRFRAVAVGHIVSEN